MNYALLFLDRATQGQDGGVCMCACVFENVWRISLKHTVNTATEAYSQGKELTVITLLKILFCCTDMCGLMLKLPPAQFSSVCT